MSFKHSLYTFFGFRLNIAKELEKLYFHSNFHEIWWKNEFFIAINVFFFLGKNSKRSNFYKYQNFTKRITPQCLSMIILYVVNFCANKIITPCIYGTNCKILENNNQFTQFFTPESSIFDDFFRLSFLEI